MDEIKERIVTSCAHIGLSADIRQVSLIGCFLRAENENRITINHRDIFETTVYIKSSLPKLEITTDDCVPVGISCRAVHGGSDCIQAAGNSPSVQKPRLSTVCRHYSVCHGLNDESYNHYDS